MSMFNDPHPVTHDLSLKKTFSHTMQAYQNVSRTLSGVNLHPNIKAEPPCHLIELPHLRDGGLTEAQGKLFPIVRLYVKWWASNSKDGIECFDDIFGRFVLERS